MQLFRIIKFYKKSYIVLYIILIHLNLSCSLKLKYHISKNENPSNIHQSHDVQFSSNKQGNYQPNIKCQINQKWDVQNNVCVKICREDLFLEKQTNLCVKYVHQSEFYQIQHSNSHDNKLVTSQNNNSSQIKNSINKGQYEKHNFVTINTYSYSNIRPQNCKGNFTLFKSLQSKRYLCRCGHPFIVIEKMIHQSNGNRTVQSCQCALNTIYNLTSNKCICPQPFQINIKSNGLQICECPQSTYYSRQLKKCIKCDSQRQAIFENQKTGQLQCFCKQEYKQVILKNGKKSCNTSQEIINSKQFRQQIISQISIISNSNQKIINSKDPIKTLNDTKIIINSKDNSSNDKNKDSGSIQNKSKNNQNNTIIDQNTKNSDKNTQINEPSQKTNSLKKIQFIYILYFMVLIINLLWKISTIIIDGIRNKQICLLFCLILYFFETILWSFTLITLFTSIYCFVIMINCFSNNQRITNRLVFIPFIIDLVFHIYQFIYWGVKNRLFKKILININYDENNNDNQTQDLNDGNYKKNTQLLLICLLLRCLRNCSNLN